MTAPGLRAYQTDIVTEFYRSVVAGQKKVLLVAPTAAGKTVIMAAIIARAVAEQKRVLVIAEVARS
jgi:DNA repair protein RadD